MGRILIFYKYVELAHPEEIMTWQRSLCEELQLKGRVLLAHEGINATLGGSIEATEQYKQAMLTHPLFSDIDFKESEGSAAHFPRLQVKVKNEIVRLGVDPSVVSARDAGVYLSPEEVHQLMDENPEDLLLLDTRNNYESRIGTFEKAIIPDINNFRDLPGYIDSNLDQFKDKKVVMFCTAGVRCERATAYLKLKEVAKEVYHIKGGIHRYIEAFPNGHFKGKNYVFDARIAVKVTNDILSNCLVCSVPYDDYTNCVNAECNKQIIVCPTCIVTYHNTCSDICLSLVQEKKVNIRIAPRKAVSTDENDQHARQ